MNYEPQHFAAPDGTALVVITREEYDRLTTADVDEDAEDVAAADRARADPARYPAQVVADMVTGGLTPLAAWRKYRGLSQAALGAAAGITQAAVARLEKTDGARERFGWPRTRDALAKALDIPVSVLSPFDD